MPVEKKNPETPEEKSREQGLVDPRKWWIPASLALVMVGSAFVLGGQYMASRNAIEKLSSVPTEEGMKLSITEALGPLQTAVTEMRVEQRVQNQGTTDRLKDLAERVQRLEDSNH